ncbi:MAG: hypothetical protein MJ041_05360, partial [Acidaminococcaceae bacterium]|nr:hypothetical protein [Acidaminococcaceae bacterium]
PITTPGGDIQDSKVKILGAVTRDNFTNTFDSRIDNSTVIAKSTGGDAIGVQSKSNGSLVTVAAGVQVGKESAAGASGSVVLNYVEDTVTATVNDSVLKADSTRIYADDKSQTVGVAGAVGVKTGTSSLAILSAGLTWAQAGLNNLTGARMLGSTLDRYSSAGQANLTVQAVNDFSLYSVAAEVDVNIQYAGQEPVAVGRGAYAYNYGTNNSEALVDKTAKKNSKISNAGKVEVTTNDKSKELAVAAAVGVNGGKVTGGAHIAKSYVGEADADKHQKNNAAIRNTEIALAGTESALKLQAYDDSMLTTIAVGGGYTGDGLLNLNGSVAKAKNYKDVETTLADSKIGVKAGVTCKALEVLAENHMKMTTSADGASVSKGTYVSGAAGVATNDSVMITKAQALRVVGADAAVGNMRVGAYSYNTLTNVGVSLTGTFDNEKAFSVDALANVAVNDLKNDTIALVDYLNVDGADTFTVEAKSEEKITNVVGAANVQIKAGADKGFAFGFGASVALNDIHGDTVAEVGNSDIKVKDKFSVNSDAFHKNKNVVFSGGLMVNTSVNANVSVGANAVVSDNEIGGKTGAYLNNSDVNKGVNSSGAVVDVKANDKIELDSTVADAQLMINVNLNPVAPNVALALGAGELLEALNRDTAATGTGGTGKHRVIKPKQI